MGTMFSDNIKRIAKEKGTNVKAIEKDLSFANAYIRNLKDETAPFHRLKAIADYLSVSINEIVGDPNEEIEADDFQAGYKDFVLLKDAELVERMRKVSNLPDEQKQVIFKMIDMI